MRLFVGWRLVLLSLCLTAALPLWIILRAVPNFRFDNGCTVHVESALSMRYLSTQIDYATAEMTMAREYLERHNLTRGHTSIFSDSSDEDLEVYYEAIRAKERYLENLQQGHSVWLTVLDEDERQRELIFDEHTTSRFNPPSGIGAYPHNQAYFWLFWPALLMTALGIYGLMCWFEQASK